MNAKKKNSNLTGRQKFYIFFAVVFIVVGLLIGGGVKDVVRALDSRQRDMAIEEAEALQSLKIVSKKVSIIAFGILLKVGGVVMLGYAVFFVIAIARNWLDLKSRQVQAKNGLFPLIRVDDGALYDANRAMGENPLITLGALEVQKTSALHADKITVTHKPVQSLQSGNGQAALEDDGFQFRDKINLPQLMQSEGLTPSIENLVVGVSKNGIETMSVHELMHMLVVGASGWGKSKMLAMLMYQMAKAQDDFDVIAIDVHGSVFNAIYNWNRLRFPLARSNEEAIAVLSETNNEIERRKALYEKYPLADNLTRYNAISDTPLKPLVVLIDEGTILLSNSDVGQYVEKAVQGSRQYGVYIFLTGQSVKHNIVKTETRDNFSSRFAFYLPSKSSVNMAIGVSRDAPKAKGRCLASLNGREIEEIQIPWIERRDLIKAIARGTPRQVMPVIEAQVAKNENAQMVIDLKADGLSDTAIAREVYGHGNMFYIEKVRGTLQQQ